MQCQKNVPSAPHVGSTHAETLASPRGHSTPQELSDLISTVGDQFALYCRYV
jgi:hypothetical protein